MLKRLLQGAGRVIRGLASGLLALLILFEEWGWEPLQRAMAWVARLPVLRQLEAVISRLPPRWALAVFVLPSLMLLPLKLLALWLLAQGHQMLGVGLVLLAKLVGTAVVARLFTLTRPALMQLAWFAALYTRWIGWKGALLARVRASFAWRWGRAFKRQVKRRWARWRAAFG